MVMVVLGGNGGNGGDGGDGWKRVVMDVEGDVRE